MENMEQTHPAPQLCLLGLQLQVAMLQCSHLARRPLGNYTGNAQENINDTRYFILGSNLTLIVSHRRIIMLFITFTIRATLVVFDLCACL